MDDFFKNAWNGLGGSLWLAIGGVGALLVKHWTDTGALSAEGAAALSIVALIFLGVLLILWKRNYDLLGAGGEPVGSDARRRYDEQRARLAGTGLAEKLYERWLGKGLDKVDRFFEGRAREAGEPPPNWTAASYDKCLLLALVYPILTLYLFWAISNHIGDAEAALGLTDTLEGWKRALAVASVAAVAGAFFQLLRLEVSLTNSILVIVFSLAAILAFTSAGASVAAGYACLIVALVISGVVYLAGNFAPVGAPIVALAIAAAVDLVASNAGVRIFLGASIVTLGGVYGTWRFYRIEALRRRRGTFLIAFSTFLSVGCFAAAYTLAQSPNWRDRGALLLFFGLFTLLNAPFDWLCLGFTRFLLRRGLEWKGWWPVGYALFDIGATTVIVHLLTLTLIAGVQLFDGLAVLRGAKPIVPLDDIFAAVAVNPWDPKNWWVYSLLLSTYIPSLANLLIGGAAWVRGVPGVSRFLAAQMPEGQAVAAFERTWMSLLMTLQTALGMILGAAAFFGTVWLIYNNALPLLGLELFDVAGEFESLNLPGRAIAFFAHRP
ncbi:MAG: hypothetical protein WBS22_09285 [Methylocystis sp.]